MLQDIRDTVLGGGSISVEQAVALYHDADDALLSELATSVRDRHNPPGVATYLIMAIVNYTNVCVANCDYCAFYRKPGAADAYLLSTDEVCRRIDEMVSLGGTLVGFNGGFHPKLRIADYARFFSEVHARFPDLAFYELTVAEFMFYCKVSKVSYAEGARILGDAGTRWITGGGAEVLAESFRKRHSPLKYTVADYYDAQRAIVEAGLGSTATMVIGFDETLDERMEHLAALREFQDATGGALPSFLCWTYKPLASALGGGEVGVPEYLRWLAISRIFLHNIPHIRTSVLTKNAQALRGLAFGADDFDLPTEDEVTQKAGATISHAFDDILQAARAAGYTPTKRGPFAIPATGSSR
jgi:cyclic dehypoxanthinyl futalosine synthase